MGTVTGTLLLVLVVVTALAFDFTNGFNDTGNAMASSIATGALKPKPAVTLAAVLNLVGAMLSLTVAATIAKGLVDASVVTLPVVFGGLVGGICWNLTTWLLAIPSSSSHALVGGIVGSVLAAAGTSGVLWSGLVAKVVMPAVCAPAVAILVASIGTRLVVRITRDLPPDPAGHRYRWGQIGAASLISLAHGTNDAQKSMGIILLALIAGGAVPASAGVPLWVILSCAAAMAAGTYLGGWRVIRTLGRGLTEIEARQGMAADMSSASVILLSSHFGFSLSTTQVASGSILGSGVGMPGATVRWRVVRKMGTAWLITLPCAGTVGALCYGIQAVIHGALGTTIVFGLLVGVAVSAYLGARRSPISAHNVTQEWHEPGEVARAAAADADTLLADARGTDALPLPADARGTDSLLVHSAVSDDDTTASGGRSRELPA